MARRGEETRGDADAKQAGDAIDALGEIARSGACWLVGNGSWWPGGERGWSSLGQQLSVLAGADPRHCAELGRRWITSSLAIAEEEGKAGRFDLGQEIGHVALAIAEWRACEIDGEPWRPQWGLNSYYTTESDDEGGTREEIRCELVGEKTLAPQDLEVWHGFCSLSDTYNAREHGHISPKAIMDEQVGIWGLWRAADHKEASRLVMVSLAYFEGATLGATVVEAQARGRPRQKRPRM